ncbi:MAG: NADH-quinone oxidoreductase subunit M [Firmicutes bacterium]|uniref:NADH-quinone oxidoreductase subunit M n=1 Tax=Melghirimyces thermohalophilus TaxID=1236220 RepID=A0A1G6MCM7_9BACL|nr:NADH-quinone oxidoreductase subunit M [Melghirimyces thermohalophilus]MDA8354585.1 NADH-quinone oxidoreductase subunit M [Bacillota bacterium]SDC53273.1 NADH-quinone oxidoreductase subunit M [Melghirimyces thermohalophilus]
MMEQLQQALPIGLVFSPLIGVIVLLCIPRDKAGWLKGVGILATLPPSVLALLLYFQFDARAGGVQFEQRLPWFQIQLPQIPPWEVAFHFGVDGLSLPLAVMAALVATLAACASVYIQKRLKGYFLLFLLLEVGMLGVFLARNMFLFFLFFEVTLVTLFFLIGIWGSIYREKAANRFLLYNGLGSAFLLLAMIGLFVLFQSLDYSRMQEMAHDSRIQAMLAQEPVNNIVRGIFLCTVVAFAIKLPMFPFHTWMLRVHAEAPPAVVMIHSGVLLKMGAYGLIRFGVELFPQQMQAFAGVLALLGLINILYGAALAFVQNELRRLLAYASVSHMGIILFGIAALNVSGLTGAVFQAVSHGFISALLFFFIGSLYERTGTTDIRQLGGMARPAPVLTGIFLAGGLALLGLPGMSGFISEFLAFLGLFHEEPGLAAAGVLGLVLAAAYTLRAVLKAGFGPVAEQIKGMADTRWPETAPMMVLLSCIILIGVWPDVLGEPMKVTIQTIASRIGG